MTGSRNRVLINCYRHDAHKMNGQPHNYAPETFAGVPVNQTVPQGADGDASALSRPNSQPEQTMENHETLYRLSLIEGESRYDPEEFTRNGVESTVRGLHQQCILAVIPVGRGCRRSSYQTSGSLEEGCLVRQQYPTEISCRQSGSVEVPNR